jgi:DNA-binding transcriptional LysR family regulator
MNINTIDLNLFLVFKAIYASRSVTAAGDKLCMTQSAVSNALRRLRDRFNDPLFVRTPAGMQPTPMADQLIDLIDSGVASFTLAIERARKFDPATADRLFRIAINDIGQLTTVPRLFATIRAAAPAIALETISASTPQEARRLLQDGEVDVALGSWEPMGTGFYQTKLFDEDFCVLMSKDHAIQSDTLTMDEYLSAEHAAYRPSGRTANTLQEALVREGIQTRRRVVLTAAHAMGLSTIVAQSALLLTLPSRLAGALAERGSDLRMAHLPFEVLRFPIMLHWHTRSDADEAHSWFRERVGAALLHAMR